MGPSRAVGAQLSRGCLEILPSGGGNNAQLERSRSASLSQLSSVPAAKSGVDSASWYHGKISLKVEEAPDALFSASLARPSLQRPSTSSARFMPPKPRPTVIPEQPLRESLEDMPLKLCDLSEYSVLPTGPLLSRGAFTSVYVTRTTNQEYVVKQVIKRSPEKVEALIHEAAILTHLSNQTSYQDFIVGFYGMEMGISHTVLPALVFEKMGSSLRDWVGHNLSTNSSRRASKPGGLLCTITVQLTAALSWLHQQASVIHGDIKPSNMLVRFNNSNDSSSFTLCFADFASASTIDDPKVAHSGLTYAYMAPEKLKAPHDPPTTAGDVWALAISLLEIVAGRTPYGDVSPQVRKLAAIGNGEPLADVQYEVKKVECLDYVKEVLGPALVKNPQGRIKAFEWPTLAYSFFCHENAS